MESIEPNIIEENQNNIDLKSIVKEYKQYPEFKDIPDATIEVLLNKGIEISTVEQQYSYEGVLPHPSIMEGYEKFYPKTTQKLIDSYINESEHRRRLEVKMVECEIKNTSRGMNYALIVVLITVIGACLSAYLNSTIIGSIIGVGGMATLAYTFIQGRKQKQ